MTEFNRPMYWLRSSVEGLDDEVGYRGFGCLEASSIVALALKRENAPATLIRGYLLYKDGSIVVPH
ncbi:hypothetical protein GLV89_15360 [Halomonas alkaliantarctica]|nr:hypothetical protein [Halomonas alkaliantarctica]